VCKRSRKVLSIFMACVNPLGACQQRTVCLYMLAITHGRDSDLNRLSRLDSDLNRLSRCPTHNTRVFTFI
jgi:hypothetical protein